MCRLAFIWLGTVAHSVARTSLLALVLVEEQVSGLAEPDAPLAVRPERAWQPWMEASQAAAERRDALARAGVAPAAHSAEEQPDE